VTDGKCISDLWYSICIKWLR